MKILPNDFVNSPSLIKDVVLPKSTVVLVIPIDKEAPKGRIILPQVQTLRELLDNNCSAVVSTEVDLAETLTKLKNSPDLVITDSQAFKQVAEIVPKEVKLTSFSILFARMKGNLSAFVKGAEAIANLQDGDRVLILAGRRSASWRRKGGLLLSALRRGIQCETRTQPHARGAGRPSLRQDADRRSARAVDRVQRGVARALRRGGAPGGGRGDARMPTGAADGVGGLSAERSQLRPHPPGPFPARGAGSAVPFAGPRC